MHNLLFKQENNGLYLITPDQPLDLALLEQIILRHQIKVLQYRRKIAHFPTKLAQAKLLRELCDKHHTIFIINDDINLAQKSAADGIHLGKNDATIAQARAKLGARTIIGVSCYNDLNLALTAQKSGADYVAFGALFASTTKPNAQHCSLEVIKQANQQLSVPIVGIGGINFNNQYQAFTAGCSAVAMISAMY
jgi:thiamine-phosphate pyrophosphorylase